MSDKITVEEMVRWIQEQWYYLESFSPVSPLDYHMFERLVNYMVDTETQINKLANFIMQEVDGEPSQSEGAIDTAIRLIRKHLTEKPRVSREWVWKWGNTFTTYNSGRYSNEKHVMDMLTELNIEVSDVSTSDKEGRDEKT